jgi:hypothetical protein
MNISCPVCKFKGSISDHLIPEEGKHVHCPQCKAKMFIKKPVVSLTEGKSGEKKPSGMEPAGDHKAIPDDTVGPDIKVLRARCESCGGDITVPENKKVMLCPTCGANIVRQPVVEELEPGFIEFCIRAIGQAFASVFKGWGKYLTWRRARPVLVIVVVLSAPYLLFHGLQRAKEPRDDFLNKNIDVTLNFPTPSSRIPPEDEGGGILKNLVKIDVTPSDKQDKEEVRIYQIVFKDGSRSDYFRYYRRDGGIVFIMLPDGRGGAYEQEYKDFDIQSIKRIEKPPGDVKIYGIN